jgi:hypothetical protein
VRRISADGVFDAAFMPPGPRILWNAVGALPSMAAPNIPIIFPELS